MSFSRLVHFLPPLGESFFKRFHPIEDDSAYMKAGIGWLLQAKAADSEGGFAHSYALKTGWSAAYPETTGYIAKTLLLCAETDGDTEVRDVALAACDWLIDVQQNGSIASPIFSADDGVVFDTGQVLFGLIQAHRTTGDDKYLQAAKKAGDWLVTVADQQGVWTKSTHLGVPHVYNVRVAWALLELHSLTGQSDLAEIARSNINFALDNEQNGWFDNCAFNQGDMPYTHNLGYATRGLLESHALVPDENVFAAAQRSADHVLNFLHPDGFLPGQIGPDKTCDNSYVCLTGNCQFAIIWYKLHRQTGLQRYQDAADTVLDYVKSTVNIDTPRMQLRGAVAGSRPLWGPYARLSYPNWATKFFLDALLEKGT
jgi:uncharacterized protein YyaL (SSP411 family)